MNIIEHLSRTITPVLLNNVNDADGNRASLLEKVYAIIVARLADDNVANGFTSTTIANDDVGFFDRFLPELNHRNDMVKQLSTHYSVPEQETTSLISRAAPMVYNELRNLSGTTPVYTFLRNHLSSLTSVIPAWAYAFIPAGILTAMNINAPHVETTTTTQRVVDTKEEHLVRVDAPKSNPLKALLPLIGLLILGALAWAMLKGCNKEPAPVATPEPVAVSSTTSTSTTTDTTTVVTDSATATASATDSSVMGTAVVGTDANAVSSTTTTTVISTTEPSVTFEAGHLNFYFATDKDVVASGAKEKAQEILQAAKDGKVIGISGYTDSTGNAAHNADLAKRRAAAVEKFLIDNGVPAKQLKKIKPSDTVGANGKDQEGRRVEVYVVDDATPVATEVKTTTTEVKPAGDVKLTDANTSTATATDATAASSTKP